MLNVDLHRRMLISVLKEIYTDPLLRTVLGFKGGTAAMLFYELPRLSVDLDFNLLKEEEKEVVFARLKELLSKFGNLTDASEKRFTLFFLLVYKIGERNLKVEISKRPLPAVFVPNNYLGISMLVNSERDMVAGKLSALLTRKKFAARDVFDLWFFLKNNWQINENLVKENTGMSLNVALDAAKGKIAKVKKTEFLDGLGELLDEKQKVWVRENLQREAIFQLNLYLDLIKSSEIRGIG